MSDTIVETTKNNTMLITLLIIWDGFVWSGSDLLAEEMKFRLGWYSTSTTVSTGYLKSNANANKDVLS